MEASYMLRYKKIPLAGGVGEMPAVGFGTLIADPVVTRHAVAKALSVGFRHFDCAERYRNEEARPRWRLPGQRSGARRS